MKGYNVFLYQNIIMHYKYLNNKLRTFVEFLDQSIYALFRPALQIFILAPPRPSLVDSKQRSGPANLVVNQYNIVRLIALLPARWHHKTSPVGIFW